MLHSESFKSYDDAYDHAQTMMVERNSPIGIEKMSDPFRGGSVFSVKMVPADPAHRCGWETRCEIVDIGSPRVSHRPPEKTPSHPEAPSPKTPSHPEAPAAAAAPPLNDYEEKQAARKERLLERAENALVEADAQWERSRNATAGIPLGQPILVGHHSERRHRKAIERSHNAADKSLEATKKAKALKSRAAAVGRGGISSDDPDAIPKLEARLAEMEALREKYKAHNKKARKAKEETLPAYALQNLGGNIRRVRERIADLQREEAERAKVEAGEVEAPPPILGEGYSITEDIVDNRIWIEFARGKPPAAVRDIVKRHGFRWSPTREAWIFGLHNGGRHRASQIHSALEALKGQS